MTENLFFVELGTKACLKTPNSKNILWVYVVIVASYLAKVKATERNRLGPPDSLFLGQNIKRNHFNKKLGHEEERQIRLHWAQETPGAVPGCPTKFYIRVWLTRKATASNPVSMRERYSPHVPISNCRVE